MTKSSEQTHERICGARARSGNPCKNPPIAGKRRCRMHGGTHGSGAPTGNRNALKHGLYTAGAKAERREVRRLIAESEALLQPLAEAESPGG